MKVRNFTGYAFIFAAAIWGAGSADSPVNQLQPMWFQLMPLGFLAIGLVILVGFGSWKGLIRWG